MTGIEVGAGFAAFAASAGQAAVAAAPYIAAASAVVGGIAANDAGQQRASAMRANAERTKEQGTLERTTAEAEAGRIQDVNRRRIASASAAMGANGVDLGSGSALDVMGDIAAEGALDVEITRWRGRQAEITRNRQASGMNVDARLTETAARTQAITGTASTLLTLGPQLYRGAPRQAATDTWGNS